MSYTRVTKEIADYTASALPALNLVAATNLFVGHMIPDPDDVTMFFDAAGPRQDQYLNTMHVNLEVWTRDRGGDISYERLNEIFELLHRLQNVQLERYFLYWLEATTHIMDMDRDEMGRKLYKVAFHAIVRDTNMIS